METKHLLWKIPIVFISNLIIILVGYYNGWLANFGFEFLVVLVGLTAGNMALSQILNSFDLNN